MERQEVPSPGAESAQEVPSQGAESAQEVAVAIVWAVPRGVVRDCARVVRVAVRWANVAQAQAQVPRGASRWAVPAAK